MRFCFYISLCIFWKAAAQNFRYFNPSFSPSGKQIVFETGAIGQNNIWICSDDGNNLHRIGDTLLDYGQPAWSPDGKSLIYYGGGKPMQLYVFSLRDKKQNSIKTPGDAYLPSWSKKNKIAFNSRKLGQNYNEVSTMNLDGSELTRVADTLHEYLQAKWSADGKELVFVQAVTFKKSWRLLSEAEKNVMQKSRELMIKKENGEIIQLTSDSVSQSAPVWSNDGQKIYFLSEEKDDLYLNEMLLKDKKISKLKKLEGIIQSISVSPDDRKFIYAARRDDVSGIYVWDRKDDKEISISEDW